VSINIISISANNKIQSKEYISLEVKEHRQIEETLPQKDFAQQGDVPVKENRL